VVRVNGASTPANALGEWLGLSWLTPSMDRLFTDSAGARRRYLDRLALALDPAHAGRAARYDNALRERNRLLSDDTEPDPDWLEAIEAQLAECGSALSRTRAALVDALDTALDRLPDQPFARPTLTYQAGGPLARDGLADALRASRRQDRAARRTLTGPHRDELEVRMASKAMPASECSTGEQKAMLIAITLAHAELAAGERPRILLLDEVAAHLDPLRREALFERLLAGKAQVWMTGTERAPFAAIGTQPAVWKIAQGEALRTS
jgi:DNA replication and repair protein RecF